MSVFSRKGLDGKGVLCFTKGGNKIKVGKMTQLLRC